jgi:hypothetical protein
MPTTSSRPSVPSIMPPGMVRRIWASSILGDIHVHTEANTGVIRCLYHLPVQKSTAIHTLQSKAFLAHFGLDTTARRLSQANKKQRLMVTPTLGQSLAHIRMRLCLAVQRHSRRKQEQGNTPKHVQFLQIWTKRTEMKTSQWTSPVTRRPPMPQERVSVILQTPSTSVPQEGLSSAKDILLLACHNP